MSVSLDEVKVEIWNVNEDGIFPLRLSPVSY